MLPYINIFGLEIPMYGLLIAIGTLIGFFILFKTSKYRGLTEDDSYYCAIWCAVGGLLGAKLLYIIVEFDQLLADPAGFLSSIITGGLVFYGGLIGGILAGFIYVRVKKLSFLAIADTIIVPFTLIHAFGRVGCFFAGCCYGRVCDSFISVVYPAGSAAPAGVPVLPVQLMEAAFLICLFFYLFNELKKVKREGIVLGKYVIAYAIWRFILEYLRSDDRGAVGFLSTSQLISLLLLPLGIAILWYAKNREKHLAE